MKLIVLNGRRIHSKEEFHKEIKDKFDFPSYYGANLDALWDMLTTINHHTTIRLINHKLLVEKLGPYGEKILDLLQDLVGENKKINLILDPK
ncbi:MAG TPA: barstar family protein [Tissierellaceae bacterium]|nr:barstar family protein [Tissierellaceae bacterium]